MDAQGRYDGCGVTKKGAAAKSKFLAGSGSLFNRFGVT
jgi:hypothetical protein